ncbi:MAG: hypothetical protein KC433_24625 [Anaerolineales bacterium]|nr:hypothetical protein [Anaerolineales bacterium]MCB8936927.1 hypothetical protein [Ardenticatenaceae bacterium]
MRLPEKKLTANSGQYLLWVGLAMSLLLIGFFVLRGNRPSSGKATGDLISAQTLAEQYGIRVNLIGITAAGGLVDLRLKILDAEKASLLLQDSSDVPTLVVGNGAAVLVAPEDSTGQLLNNLMDDGNVFLAFPNVRNVLKPGMLVTVQFGELRLEPITVK